jgi:CRP/FNR family transcriptional regulator
MQYNVKCSKNQQDCSNCYIRSLTLCNALSASEQNEFQKLISSEGLQTRKVLFSENDVAEYVYIVTSGNLKLEKSLPDGRTQIIGFAIPGDLLGNPRETTYHYSAVSFTDCSFCKYPRVAFAEFLDNHPKMIEELFERIMVETNDNHNLMLLLGCKTAIEKVASFIWNLSEKSIRIGLGTTQIQLPMSRTDMGDYLGLTTESVSRSFTKLKNAGVIELDNPKRVTIIDMVALKQLKDSA